MGITNIAGVGVYEYYQLQGQFSSAVFNPADNTTYYGGDRPSLSTTTTAGRSQIYIPIAGTIAYAEAFVAVDGTLASDNPSSIWIRKNNSTDTLITDDFSFTATTQRHFNNTVGLAVSNNDYIEFKWTAPTWTTNPTSVRIICRVLIRKNNLNY